MKPKFPDLINFEYFASNEEPSLEGSSIISLHTIEHIYNTMAKRDPLNNQIKSQPFADIANLIEQTESSTAKRPVPLDRVHQLYLYAQKQMANIANNPSRKLVKETAYILPSQLKTPRTKTMNWIANQPGRNIREKIAGKRVLAEKTIFVVDTKENQVFYRVMTQLSKEFQNRLAFGVDTHAYDKQATDYQRIEEMKHFLSVYKKVKYSELGDIDISKPVIEPNNRLISDKNYAPIWRLYNELNNRKFNIQKNSEYIYQRFEDVAYLYIAFMLNEYTAITSLDLPMQVNDETTHLQAQAYANSELMKFHYFYESQSQIQHEELVKIKAVQLGMKRVVCETKTGEELIIPATDFPSLGHFGKIRNAKWLSLKTLEPATAEAAPTEIEAFFTRLTMQQTPCKQLTITRLKQVLQRYEVQSQVAIQFSIEMREGQIMAKRGLPITLIIERDNKKKYIETFADLQGLNDIATAVRNEITVVAPFDFQKRSQPPTSPKNHVNQITMDFTSHVANLYMNNELITLHDNYLVRYNHHSVDERQFIQPNSNYLYEFDKQHASFFDSLDVENEHYKWNIDYFTLLIQQLHATQQINAVTPFVYMVPDNIDEFAQVDIKKALNISYKKNFPIWRSVAGALTAQQYLQKQQLERLIIIDTQGPQLNATQLRFVEKNKQWLFMHYPSYEIDATLEKKLTLKHLSQTYVTLYNEKYALHLNELCLQNIVTSGLAERCMIHKERQLILPSEQQQPFYLTFDEQLYDAAITQWLQVYEHFLRKLKSEIKSDFTTTTIIGLFDFEVDSQCLQAIYERVLRNVPTYRYKTADLLATISTETILHKLLNSEPIWFEYLPDLSLDVIRDGTYDSLPLIKDQFIGNTMGAQELFEIEETLVLPEGQLSYLFPLKRGGSLGGKINAVIQHPAFPLKADLEVSLAIEYKYGYENSYRLLLKPIETHPVIKQLEVQWVQEEKATSNTQVQGYLEVPLGAMTAQEIEAAQHSIDETLSKALVIKEAFNNNGIVRTNELFALNNQLFKAIYLVRKLLRQENTDVHRYLSNIVRSEVYAYLRNMSTAIPQNIIKGSREDVFNKLFKIAIRFVCSFGEHVPRADVDRMIMEALKNKSYIDYLYALLYRNSHYRPLVQAVDQSIRERPKTAIRSLRDSVWRDPNILQNMYAENYKILECIYGEIKRELKLSAQYKKINNILYTRDCLEVLLAMLAIRNKPHFEFMEAGSAKALKLAKNIRDVEAVLYEQYQRTTPTLLQFELEKPSGLWKLSDIGFVLNAYLTGEVQENLISVRAITEEGNEG